MGDFRKKILQTDFKGKIIMQGTIWEKKFSNEKNPSLVAYNAGKKNLIWVYVREKNSISRGLGEKNSYTNQITLT